MIMAKCSEYRDRLLEILLRIALSSAEGGMSNTQTIDTRFQSDCSENIMKYLAIALTAIGMAVRDVVLQLKRYGLSVWSQAYPGCAVCGMPDVIIEARLPDRISLITEISRQVVPRV
jgi:chemotaxis response regulator CheB